MKNMRAILVNQNAGLVVMIVSIAADVRTLVADQNFLFEPAASRSASTLPAKPAPTIK